MPNFSKTGLQMAPNGKLNQLNYFLFLTSNTNKYPTIYSLFIYKIKTSTSSDIIGYLLDTLTNLITPKVCFIIHNEKFDKTSLFKKFIGKNFLS